MTEHVVLVDTNDQPLGTMDKLEAHQKGLLHRAFSVIVLNSKGEILLQRRAYEKYHSGGLWTNTCCSHPRPGEDLSTAAQRRLKEEMGLECELVYAFYFIYKVSFSNGLTENELDHVFLGWCNDLPIINKEEVEEFKYMTLSAIQEDVEKHPDSYTEWFKMLIGKIEGEIDKLLKK